MLECAGRAGEIRAAAPYVTDARLFKSAKPGAARLFTDFSAMSFISGASSLQVLRKLITAGVQVFHVDALHAKVVLLDGKHFSVGSQNLTLKGRRNREASFVSGSDTPADEVSAFFVALEEQAMRLEPADLDEMERQIEPLRIPFEKLQDDAALADQAIAASREAREQEKLRRAMQQAIVRTRKRARGRAASQALIATVKTLENFSRDIFMPSTFTKSLVPLGGADFLELVRSLGIRPRHLFRYLLIDLEIGKLAYARLASSRISFFASGLRPHETFEFRAGPQHIDRYQVEIDLEQDQEQLKSRNVSVKLKMGSGAQSSTLGEADFAFSLAGLELVSTRLAWRNLFAQILLPNQRVEDALQSEGLRRFVHSQLVQPFKFKENLLGMNAANFFGNGNSSRFEIKAVKVGGDVVFSSRLLPS